MQYIHGRQGRFFTVLPKSRKEDAAFRAWIQDHEVAWEEIVCDLPQPGRSLNEWRMVESPVPSGDAFRLVWVWSSRMAAEDAAARQDVIDRAVRRIDALAAKLANPRTGYKDESSVAKAAEKAVGALARRWIDVEVQTVDEVSHKQAGPGRPGPKTKYRRVVKPRFRVAWRVTTEHVEYDARSDGMFPLLTNVPSEELCSAAVLDAYRFQPRVEKRHEQLKTVYGVAPVLLKKVARVEALLFLYFTALLVQALIERDVRRAMRARGIASLPLYPEGRAARAPTTNVILGLFADTQLHRLYDADDLVQVFPPEVSPTQEQLLELVGVAASSWTRLS